MQLFNQAKQLHELIPDGNNTILYAYTLHMIGMIQYDKQNYDEALNLYKQSLSIKQKITGRNTETCANTLNNMGLIYQLKKDYDKAFNCYQEVLKIY